MIEKRLFVVSNRLPVQISEADGQLQVKASAGGLVSAMNSYFNGGADRFSSKFWVGVPGCSAVSWEMAADKMAPNGYEYLPVFMNQDIYDKYYDGFSNSALWPLFHYFPSFVDYRNDEFEAYLLANQLFLEAMAKQLRPGDTVWIHDYHLMPLAQLLRERIPELTIGFFLHIPFPSYEIFRLLPNSWQEALLKGVLGADLIGFHTIDYAAHFIQTLQMALGLDQDRHIVHHCNRLVKIDVFPISIDYNRFHEAFDQERIVRSRMKFREKMKGKKVIFSVDRLDYTKGLENRLKAYELFLRQNPEYCNKVVFVLVIVPSRDNISKYAERKRLINELISQVNSQIGTIHWQPVLYQYSALSFSDMLTYYTACDLALITPLRDGMNLVAKEFVASRKDKRGVLVLSAMAGAARELAEALIINPNDASDIAEKIRTGLEMDADDQGWRLECMQRRISNYDVSAWVNDFMIELHNIKNKQDTFQIKFIDGQSRTAILDAYRHAGRRLFLLDYDGTLVPYASDPGQAVPGPELLRVIGDLAREARNDIYIISGRSSSWLEKQFNSIPVHLIAEHGARSKMAGGQWLTEVQTHNEWKTDVHHIMEMYVRRCAQSFIEEKDFSLVWHFRNAAADHGNLRALELCTELNDYIRHRRLEVLRGNKIVEVRNSGIDKGTAIKNILAAHPYDFIFAVGDDKTDEDMFRQLANVENSYTVKVGPEASYAHYNLLTPQMVVSLLHAASGLPSAAAIT